MVVKLMRNSFRIFRIDLGKILSNWVSLVVIGGLIFLPSLYAWVNIYASWDPYGNTKGIKVAIVNEDVGGSIRDTEINIGKDVVKSLTENNALGWVFYDTREEGMAAVTKGDVYATLIIPADFSEKILTLVDADPVKPDLEYYVNEKINAIAPKITDKGATTIQHQITTSFIETVANKIISAMHDIGIELDAQYPTVQRLEDLMTQLSDRCPGLEGRLQSLADTANNGRVAIERNDKNIVSLQNIIEQLASFNGDIAENLRDLSTKPEEVIPEIKENLVLIQTIFADISKSTAELKNSIELNKPTLINDINTSISKMENAKTRLIELADKAAELDRDLSSSITSTKNEMINILDDYIVTLRNLQDKLDNADQVIATLDKLEKLSTALSADITKLKTNIQKIGQKLNSQLLALQTILSKIEAIVPPIIKPQAPPVTQPPVSGEPETPPDAEEAPVVDENIDTEEINGPPADVDTLFTNPIGEEEESVETANTDNGVFESQVNETIDLINTTQENLSNNPEVFGDAIYALNNIKAKLTELIGLSDNPTLAGQKLNELKANNGGLSSAIGNIRTLIEVRITSLSDKLTTLEELMNDTVTAIKRFKVTINDIATGGSEKIDSIIVNIETVQDKLSDVAKRVVKTLHSESARIQEKVEEVNSDLTVLQERLASLRGKLEDKVVVEETLQNISELTYNIQASLDNTINLLDSDLIAKLKEQLSKMASFVDDTTGLLTSIQDELNYLRDFGTRLSEKSEVLESDILEIKSHIPTLQEKINKVRNKIAELNENVDIRDLINQLTADNSNKSDFLASPVVLKTTALYPVPNYGTGLAPFYTTLCLWVGALLLTSLLTTEAKNADFKYTPLEEYFGKFFLFALCGILQAFIAASGDIIVLGVVAKNPLLFVVLGMAYSVVFIAIVYTLVALFSNVGKALGVVLLVLQLGGSGGTFPIQVTPILFQRLYNLLPFTYAISGMREAIAGIYYETLIKDIIVLFCFLIGALIIGALLKQKANEKLHKFSKKLGESGVVEH